MEDEEFGSFLRQINVKLGNVGYKLSAVRVKLDNVQDKLSAVHTDLEAEEAIECQITYSNWSKS